MNLIACGACGSQFDVSKMTPGSSFACGKCKAVMTVPGGARPATASTSTPKLPKAMQKRLAEQSSSRAAGATPAAQPAAQPAKSGGGKPARRRERTAAPESSGTGLYVGIGVGVLVLGGIGFAVFSGGGGGGGDGKDGGESADVASTDSGSDGASSDTGVDGATPKKITAGETAPPKVLDEWDKFLALPDDEQVAEVTKRVGEAQHSTDRLKQLAKWFQADKLADNGAAKKALGRIGNLALKKDKELEWARELTGERRLSALLQKCLDDCQRAFSFRDANEDLVVAKMNEIEKDESKEWVRSEEYAKFERVVAAIHERDQQLEEDPRLVQVEKARDWVRKHEFLSSIKDNLVSSFADPYVIFQEIKSTEKTAEEIGQRRYDKLVRSRRLRGEINLRRDAIIFQEAHANFRRLLAERFKLPTLEEKGRLLKALVLYNQTAFANYFKEEHGNYPNPGLRAYYSPAYKHIIHYMGEGAARAQDETKCAHNRIQKSSDQVTFHEGTHQLVHEYGAIFNGAPLKDTTDLQRGERTMWFSEGFAEFMGAPEYDAKYKVTLEGVEWFHNRILLSRVHFARRLRSEKAKSWSVSELVQPRSNQDMQEGAAKKGNTNLYVNLFYAQSWGLVHFMYFYDGGKYRGKLLDYMELEFRGTSSPKGLADIFGRPSVDDWGDMEKEFAWYWRQLLMRKVGRKIRGGADVGWHTPETGPPEGNMQQDEADDDYPDDEDEDEDEDE